MAVSFSHIPSNIRVPLFYAEVSNELAGHLSMQQPALLIGPAIDAGPDVLNTPILVTSGDMAHETFGPGSVLADMVAVYRRNDTFGELWAIAVDPGSSAAPARGSLTINGTAVAGGTLPVYIGGDLYRIGVSNGATGAAIAAALQVAINDNPFALVGASGAVPADLVVSSANGFGLSSSTSLGSRPLALSEPGEPGSLELTARQPGEIGNDIDIRIAWRGLAAGEVVPPGLDIEITPMANGAGIPNLKPALDAMGDDVYDYCAIPYTDGASLDAVQAAMDDITGRWAWDRQIYGHFFSAKMGDVASLQSFGRTRNDQHFSVLGFAASPSPAWRRAASLTAQAATALRNDPARPLQTLPLKGVFAPDRRSKFTISQRNTLLYSGIAVEDEVAGEVRINRCVTTYQRNAWGQPDPSYLDVTTPATVQYFIRFIRQRILQKFPRHKLADDSTAFGPGQAIVTPRIIKAEIIAAYLEMVEAGIVENVDSFKDLLIVERDANDPNRVNVLASPDLVNQLRVLAMLVAFRLQSAAQPVAAAA